MERYNGEFEETERKTKHTLCNILSIHSQFNLANWFSMLFTFLSLRIGRCLHTHTYQVIQSLTYSSICYIWCMYSTIQWFFLPDLPMWMRIFPFYSFHLNFFFHFSKFSFYFEFHCWRKSIHYLNYVYIYYKKKFTHIKKYEELAQKKMK